MSELEDIKKLTDANNDRELGVLGAPFLLRTFGFIVKEFSQCFKKIRIDNFDSSFVLKGLNPVRFGICSQEFSCNRYVINEHSKLVVGRGDTWEIAGFEDFRLLFSIIDKNALISGEESDIESKIRKLKQQTRYYVFISKCASLARSKLSKFFDNEESLYREIIFNKRHRNLSFVLLDCFGVINGHLDHPTPYPYHNLIDINMLGNDPFLSLLHVLDDLILMDDEEFASSNMSTFSKNESKQNVNGVDLALVPKEIFEERLHEGLSRLSSMYLENIRIHYDKDFSYDKRESFLFPFSKIERKLTEALSERPKSLNDVIFLDYSIPAVSTSSGRSMIIPVSDSGKHGLLYIKTSWPDVVKTSLNRGLSPSKIQWFKICSKIYENFPEKYFYYLSDKNYHPKSTEYYHLAFIERDYRPILERKSTEFVLPLIGLASPGHNFCWKGNSISYLASQNGGDKFIRQIVKCITDAIIFQLLDKGVFHGLHLQNCCILFRKHKNGIVAEKVVARDGDIRMCEDYLTLLSEEEIAMVEGLTKKKGKISSKSGFYKYFFHNIINENLGNIEQCLMEDNFLDSETYWKIVHDCFMNSLNKNISVLQNEGRFNDTRSSICCDFKRMIFASPGYSANFYMMEYLGMDEGFIMVDNPFIYHKIS